jgi:molecular chaperone DnaK (HSP70)
MATIGIDFGTSFCSASWINPNTGKPEAVRFKDCGSEKLPSIIAFNAKEQPFVGSGPYMQLEELSANTSLSQEERDVMLRNFYTSIKTNIRKDNKWRRHNKTYEDADLISFILKKIKDEVAISCPIDEPIEQVILTHPVQFEEWKKDILKHAAALAGFNKVKLLEEPIAAAIYAIKSGTVPKTCKGLLVYDFGAGTFDVSYIQVENDGELHMPVIPRGDAHCGGDDIDRALYADWDKYIQATYNRPIGTDGELDIAFLYRCRRRKELISKGLMMPEREYIPEIGTVKRSFSDEDFERLTKPVIDKTIALVKIVVDEVELNKLPLTHAILIGGSSNLPQVQTAMKELLGDSVQIVTTGNNDIAVAVGAMYSVETQTHISKPHQNCYCIYCGKNLIISDRMCWHCGRPNWSYGRTL